MIEDLPAVVNGNAALVRRGRFLTTTILIEVGAEPYLVRVDEGRIEAVMRGPHVMPSWSFALRASSEAWAAFWEPRPAPGMHDLLALVKARLLRVEGDVKLFMTHLRYVKEILGALRPAHDNRRPSR